MPLTLEQLRNSIRVVPCDHDPISHGFCWHIDNQAALAQLVAWTIQGHYLHAERVLKALGLSQIGTVPTIQQQAMNHLRLPPNTGDGPVRWHRDGLVFQHIAWLAAVIRERQSVAISIPHFIPAQKGFDALLVPLNDPRTARAGIVICEEKATTNPRKQITQEVCAHSDQFGHPFRK